MPLRIFILFLCLVFSQVVWGKNFSWKKDSFAVKFDVNLPGDWKEVIDLYGVPVTLLGPFEEKSRSRAIIQIVPSPIDPKKVKGKGYGNLNDEQLEKIGTEYLSMRKIALEKSGAKIEQVHTPRLRKIKSGQDLLEVGIRYFMEEKGFTVLSSYVFCPKELYNIRIFLRDGNLSKLPLAREIVGSFQCGK